MTTAAQQFRTLTIHRLQDAVRFKEPYYQQPNSVYPEASALEVMTDLNFVPAAAVRVDASLEHAHQVMIDRGVRLVFAVDAGHMVLGLLTATDVLGARSATAAQGLGISKDELRVRDVMTPVAQIEVLALVEVVHARVGDIVATLRHSGRQHALVVDRNMPDDSLVIRGIFSASQIARQLGIAVKPGNLEHTFEQIDETIGQLQAQRLVKY